MAKTGVSSLMSTSGKKTLEDVQAAFETRRVLNCSNDELEQLLVAAGAETIADPAQRARVHEMNETMRRLLETRARPARSRLAVAAMWLAIAALAFSTVQFFYWQRAHATATESAAEMGDFIRATQRDMWPGDPRIQLTIDEMARRAPSLSKGTLQAWWAGEQAREVQFLEAQAKRLMLLGDREGAVRSAQRADAVRGGIETLGSFERPPQK